MRLISVRKNNQCNKITNKYFPRASIWLLIIRSSPSTLYPHPLTFSHDPDLFQPQLPASSPATHTPAVTSYTSHLYKNHPLPTSITHYFLCWGWWRSLSTPSTYHMTSPSTHIYSCAFHPPLTHSLPRLLPSLSHRGKPATLSVLNIFPATLPRIYDSKFMAEA